MRIIEPFFRFGYIFCLGLLIFALSSGLLHRFERQNELLYRLESGEVKLAKLERLAHQKKKWLSSKSPSPSEVLDRLRNFRLCKKVAHSLVQAEHHPLVREPHQLRVVLDILENNQIEMNQIRGGYSLVKPIYIETEELEKMVEIVENKGAFAPVEITDMQLERTEILGGDLWKLSCFVLRVVDQNGAL